jgi:hypothetical protein
MNEKPVIAATAYEMLWSNLHLPSPISDVTFKKFLLNLTLQNITFRFREFIEICTTESCAFLYYFLSDAL